MSNSGGDGDDLEDGEIFDEEEANTPSVPPPPPTIPIGTFVDEFRNKASPPLRKPVPNRRMKRPKRLREDERPFRNPKQRRMSEDNDKPKDKYSTEDEEMRELSPLRGEWERNHHRPGGFMDELDEEDDEMEGSRRNNRGFANRRRGGRIGGRTGGRRGGGQMNNRREGGGQICRFYLQGKCQRGNECPYSHANHQRKYELCKFYMMDCCAKKDRCPFMHSEFPCKYYHLGMKCYAGKKCKFSHGKISPQLRANLLRDSKECDFLQHLDSPPPKEEDVRRERRERARERNREREYKPKDKKKNRDRKEMRDETDKYTLHFKVDPRTISDEDEGQRTPMPSPPHDRHSSDRGSHSPEARMKNNLSPKTEIQLPDPKDSGIGDELPDFIPADLPKHQRELYKRIQQHQREATNIEDEDELEEIEREKVTEDYKEEDWYSSEEEEGGKKMEPITVILNKLKQQPPPGKPSPPAPQAPPPPIILPSTILPDIDINAVSKLLTTVRETISKQKNENPAAAALIASTPIPATTVPSISLNPLPPLNALITDTLPPAEKRRVRDPRLRGNSSEDDIDLRRQDVDLRQLPFKPAPNQPPANEIDASITAHPPITFQLIPFSPPPPPDFSHLQPKNGNDPRLKRYLPCGVVQSGGSLLIPPAVALPGTRAALATRDPRQARILANDPRRRRGDSDLRQAFNHVNDIDLRLHPPHVAFK